MPDTSLAEVLPGQADLDRLTGAVDALADDRFDEVLRTLGAGDRDGGLEGTLRLIAEALVAEAAGDAAASERLMDAAQAAGPGHPVLLRAIAGFRTRRGDVARALAVLEPLTGATFDVTAMAADPVRYAAPELRQVHHGDHPRFGGPALHKARLRQRLGTAEAAVQMAGCSHPDHPRVARRMRRHALDAWSHEHGRDVRVLAPTREVQLRAPRATGADPGRGLAGPSREVVAAALEDVVVSSHANALLTRDAVVLDITDREWDAMEPWLDLDPTIAAFDGAEVIALVPRVEPPTIDTAISLVGVSSAAFGHLMDEFLPRLWALSTLPDAAGVPVLVDAQMPPQHHEAVRYFAGPDRPVLALAAGASVRVRRLWSCTMPSYMPLGPAPGIPTPADLSVVDAAWVASVIRQLHHPEPPPGSAVRVGVYFSRRDFPRRRLVNEAEVEAELARRGYLVVDPATLTFAEQIRLVRSTRTLIAADGSASYLAYFARPGTRIGVLSHQYLDGWEAFAELCASLGLPFRMLAGTVTRLDAGYRWFSDYHIDPAALGALVDEPW